MRRYALIALCLAVAVGLTWAQTTPPKSTPPTPPKNEHKTGDITGTVSGIDTQKSERGLLIVVKISGEGQSLTLFAAPQNRSMYGAAGELKMGEKVKATWTSETAVDKKWLSQLSIVPPAPKPAATTSKPAGTK